MSRLLEEQEVHSSRLLAKHEEEKRTAMNLMMRPRTPNCPVRISNRPGILTETWCRSVWRIWGLLAGYSSALMDTLYVGHVGKGYYSEVQRSEL